MTCYQRHIGSLFDTLGLDYDKGNRKRVDAAIREILGLGPSATCPEVWSGIKALSGDEREALSARVAELL